MVSKPEDFLAVNQFFLKCFAMSPIYEGKFSLLWKIIHFTVLTIASFTSLQMVTSQLLLIYRLWDTTDMVAIPEALMTFILHLLGYIQMTYFQCNAKKLVEMLKFLNKNFRWDLGNNFENLSMAKPYRNARMFTLLLTSAFLLSKF